jgi:predicted protein tyrosine phosphatase
MPEVHVCPLSLVPDTVRRAGASHLVSLINDNTPVARPDSIVAENHLFLGINDIVEPVDGMVLPAEDHVRELLGFVEGWNRGRPIVVHCFAGISRSTAAAFITLCAVNPSRDEDEIARRLRSASRFATPNPLIVALGDRLLGRDGRMVQAIASIGRGEDAIESIPFAIPIGV